MPAEADGDPEEAPAPDPADGELAEVEDVGVDDVLAADPAAVEAEVAGADADDVALLLLEE